MLHLDLGIKIKPNLLITLYRRIFLEVIQGFEPDGRMRGAEHGDGQVARVG